MTLKVILFLSASVVIAFLTGAIFVFSQNVSPLSRDEIRTLTALLNEEAAIVTPHRSLMSIADKELHSELLSKVEAGLPLDAVESAEYRQLYQATLRSNRWRLVLFDPQLTVQTDFAMQESNNVGTLGIADDHDHHDYSSLANFKVLSVSLASLQRAKGPLDGPYRILLANRAYKNLTDIILHMATAPHTVSVDYEMISSPTDPLAVDYETMVRSYKAAQFANVNSTDYRMHIVAALNAYNRLVEETQRRIVDELSSFEQQLAGRWLAPQTLSPRPNADTTLRFPR